MQCKQTKTLHKDKYKPVLFVCFPILKIQVLGLGSLQHTAQTLSQHTAQTLSTHHMSRLARQRDHHTVTDGQSKEEVSDVGHLQAGWSPRGNVTHRQHRRTEPTQLPHQLRVWYHVLSLDRQTWEQHELIHHDSSVNKWSISVTFQVPIIDNPGKKEELTRSYAFKLGDKKKSDFLGAT